MNDSRILSAFTSNTSETREIARSDLRPLSCPPALGGSHTSCVDMWTSALYSWLPTSRSMELHLQAYLYSRLFLSFIMPAWPQDRAGRRCASSPCRSSEGAAPLCWWTWPPWSPSCCSSTLR